MDASRVQLLVEQLEDNIDDLDDNLQPVLSQALSESTKKLPLLDKAKLHVVIVYAIESLLFSYLKLHDVDAKAHPVFRELTRVKQYFEKVKKAEDGPVGPRENLSLNKQAAARIIKHALAGNEKLDLERLEREAREKLLARRKLKDLESNMKDKAQVNAQEAQSVEEELVEQIAAEIEEAEGGVRLPVTDNEEPAEPQPSTKAKKRKRKGEDQPETGSKPANSKSNKKSRKKAKKEANANEETAG